MVLGEIFIGILKKPVFYPLCRGEYRRSQIFFIIDGIFINAAIILTTGIFLSGYIVYLDGSDLLVGILNNSPNWALIVSLFAFIIYERREKRKKLLISLNIISRLLVCSTIFLPLFHGGKTVTLAVVAVMAAAGNILWGVYSVGFNIWLISIVPKESRSQFIYTRTMWLRISFTVTTLAMGFVVDAFDKSYTGFLVVFCLSLIFSILDAVILVKIKEPVNQVDSGHIFNLSEFFEPLKNAGYRKMLMFVFFYYFSLTISSSFTSLYLIRYMEFDYSFISIINIIAYFLMIICTPFWSRIESKRGLKFVLKASGLIAISEFFVYAFLTSDRQFLLFFAATLAGMGNGGFNVAVFNYRYEVMPDSNRTIYEGWYGAIFGLSVLLSPVVGNVLMKILPVVDNAVFQHSSFQLLYLVSYVLAFAAIMTAFPGEKKNKDSETCKTAC